MVVALALGLAVGWACAPSPDVTLITGKARVDLPLPPGECRRLALEGARRDANAQILKLVEDDSAPGSGASIASLMKESAYVDARVRRAIQRSRVRDAVFHDDGHAVVVLEMNVSRIGEEACLAHSELQ